MAKHPRKKKKKISSKFLEIHISSWTFGPNPSQQEDEGMTDVSQYHKELENHPAEPGLIPNPHRLEDANLLF